MQAVVPEVKAADNLYYDFDGSPWLVKARNNYKLEVSRSNRHVAYNLLLTYFLSLAPMEDCLSLPFLSTSSPA